jgi:hypothetical protein
MQPPPVDPAVADLAPSSPALTPYDEEHLVTYLRVLDADAECADWREVSRIVHEPGHLRCLQLGRYRGKGGRKAGCRFCSD